MDENKGQSTALIPLMATVNDITNGKFLVGRYDVESGKLTQVLLTNSPTAIPPANEHATYRLLATEPLDQFIGQYVTDWNGKDITLFFNANGILDHWTPTQASKAVA